MGNEEIQTTSINLFKKLVCKRKDESGILSRSLEQGLVNDSLQAGSRPVFVNKVLFEHMIAHLFTYYPWLLLSCNKSCNRDYGRRPAKPKKFT